MTLDSRLKIVSVIQMIKIKDLNDNNKIIEFKSWREAAIHFSECLGGYEILD